MGKKKTHKEYVAELATVNPNIEVIDQYIGGHVPIMHKCKIDGHEWKATPSSILDGRGCPDCAIKSRIRLLTKTHEQYVDELKQILPQIKVLENYNGGRVKILHKCAVCKHIWYVKPDQLLQGKGCPVCAGRIVGPPPEYKNSIWTSEYKDLFSKYLTTEQMKSLTPHSAKKIKISCPDCGRVKETYAAEISRRGFSCMCQDGQSYPNKFVFNVLSQLNLKITPEYSPKWAEDKRYDDYIHDYNIIVENHGLQHYKECNFSTRTLEEEQANDKYKYNLAIDNGVYEYIVLDCRRSDMDWIKKSIMQSLLPTIFNFNECDIDWVKAAEYASSNLIKSAADLFNSGYTINQIADMLFKDSTSVRNWLKDATKIGWCNYTPYDPRQSVYCIELDMRFNSISDAHKTTGVRIGSITLCCKGQQEYATTRENPNRHLHWLYVNDAVAQGYINC